MVFLDFVKLFSGVSLALLVLVLVWVLVSPLIVGWLGLVYVLVRALPAIRRDFAALYARFFPARDWRI